PKSFRVVSLTSFAMKGLEKIVDEWVKSTSLNQNPIHDSQHAYQRGKSTETALLRLLESAPSAIDEGEYALTVFMDVEYAFDKPTLETVKDAFDDHGITQTCKEFMLGMLKCRYTTMSMGESSLMVKRKAVFPREECSQQRCGTW